MTAMTDAQVLSYLLIDLVIIILVAQVFGRAMNRIGQPAVIGEIVGGILLGPTVLGRISPGLPSSIFPPEVPLNALANVGLIFFMFLVGLELDTRLIVEQGKRAAVISLGGIILPLAGGVVVGVLLSDVNAGGTFVPGAVHPPPTWVFAFFMGVAMCITAFPVLARILVETRLNKKPIGILILCAAAIDDVCAWIFFAAAVGISQTGSLLSAGRAFGLTLLFAGFMFAVVRRLLAWLAHRYEATGHLTVTQAAVVLGGVLLSAYITEEIGIHAVFGAFLMGVVMPQRSPMTRELIDKIEDFSAIVLLPAFFAVVGLRTNLFTLNSPELLGALVLILAVAVIGKFAGCGLAAWFTGSSARDATIVGALMNTRGLVEIVILTVGLNVAVISDRTYAMMVIMALVTTFMPAPIVNWLLRNELPAPELPPALETAASGVRRILVAIGNPAQSAPLIQAAAAVGGRDTPVELVLVRLVPLPEAGDFRSGMHDADRDVSRALRDLRELAARNRVTGISPVPLSFQSPDFVGDLVRLAGDLHVDTLVVDWQHPPDLRGGAAALVRRLVDQSPCTVVIVDDAAQTGPVVQSDRPVLILDEQARPTAERLGAYLGTPVQAASAKTPIEQQWAIALVAVSAPTGKVVGPRVEPLSERMHIPVYVVHQPGIHGVPPRRSAWRTMFPTQTG
jgi:Kef-type K+ transport system membrane component KefB